MALPKFKFLHCADLHLGSFFAGISSRNPEIAKILADSPFLALNNLINYARERRSDFVVIAGDVFEDAHPPLDVQLKFKDILSQIKIPVLIAGGNHDFRPEGYCDLVEYPANVFWFDRFAVKELTVNGCKIKIAGISHDRPKETRNLAREFQLAQSDDFAIGILHANINGQTDFQPYAPAPLADLSDRNIDYWALGHIHQFRILSRAPYAVYPGCIQGRSVNENGKKGFVEVQYFAPGQVEVTFCSAEGVRFEIIECEVNHLATIDQVIASTAGEIRRRELADAVIRLILKGPTPLNRELRAADPEELTAIFKSKLCISLESVKLKTANPVPPDNALAKDITEIFDTPGSLGAPAKVPVNFSADELREINLEAKAMLLDALGEE